MITFSFLDTPKVNFTNLCAPSKNLPAQIVQGKFCHLISPTKFKPNLCAEICQMLFAVLPICAPKKLLIRLCGRKSLSNMLVKFTPRAKPVVFGRWW